MIIKGEEAKAIDPTFEEEKEVILKINHQPSGGKEWVAKILGKDTKYGYQREFLQPIHRDWSSSGKTGWTYYRLERGFTYEIKFQSLIGILQTQELGAQGIDSP